MERAGSVVVASRQEMDSIVTDLIDEAMLAVDAPRPTASEFTAQAFGFAGPLKRIRKHRFNQLEYAQCPFPVGLGPIPQVVEKGWIEDRFSTPGISHSAGRPNCPRNSSTSIDSPSSASARAMAAFSRSAFFGERRR